MGTPPCVVERRTSGHTNRSPAPSLGLSAHRGAFVSQKENPPRTVPRGVLALVSAPYFFLAGFGLALVLGAFLVPHPQAMVILPLRTCG